MSENVSKGVVITVLVLCNLAAGFIYFSWYRAQDFSLADNGKMEVRYAGTSPDGIWKQLDYSIFKKLNGNLRDSNLAQRF